MMYKVFKYRLYPSKSQARRLDSVLETCRRWYNQCLEERKTAYKERSETIRRIDQLRQIKEFRATSPWGGQVYNHVLQVVVEDLDRAFQAFYRRVKAGVKPGYPRFKGRNRFSSFGYKEYTSGFKVNGRRLRLTGIGRIAVRWHRPLEGVIKTLRIHYQAGKWYACFACQVEQQTLPTSGNSIGVDVGIASLVTLSSGQKVENPRWYAGEQRRLRILQRRVARRKRDSANRRKAIHQLQRQHERIKNRRKDFLNKLTYQLIQRYDLIAVENLRINNMVRNSHISKSILDAGWGYFIRHLMNKAEEAGRQVCLVEPQNTSRLCSGCGRQFDNLSLRDRWIDCSCGVSLDRDHNAAINILNRAGQVRWASSSSLDGLAQEAAGR
jgi:putative transposase